jgi:hypothetical protein
MADAMILSGAEFSIISVTRKVVALTIISRYKLHRIFSWIAFTFSTNTITTIITKSGSGIIWSTTGLKVSVEA